jgi:ADP-heptose:LPS heptosyltransferase
MVVRLDNVGDVILAGPAVRAVAHAGDPVVFLAGPSGAAAAELLPGVSDVIVFDAPWVPFQPSPLVPGAIDDLVASVRSRMVEEAVVLTSFHQSPLPIALVLRLAGVATISATCVDYPGALLDLRHPYDEALHEVEQALSLCSAAGFDLPEGDDGRLAINLPAASLPFSEEPYVVVHVGASVPARGLPIERTARAVARLADAGLRVLLTGSASERALAEQVGSGAPPASIAVLCGATTLHELASVIAGAAAVVCGNTSVAHIAAAVGTPVVEAFAPVVPAHRWRPWRVPHVLLGTLDIGCAGCRARTCPVAGQPCLAPFTADNVLDAVARVCRPGAIAPAPSRMVAS